MDHAVRRRFSDDGMPFPIRIFPLGTDAPTTFTDPRTLFATNKIRFRARAPKAVSKHALTLWGESMEQVREGWLSAPEPLSPDGLFAHKPEEDCNIAFRFGVEQAGKLRGCGDLRDSLTNTACTIRTPITLPGWGHIAAASRILNTTQCDGSFGKVDHRSAYKAVPLRQEDSDFAIIALSLESHVEGLVRAPAAYPIIRVDRCSFTL